MSIRKSFPHKIRIIEISLICLLHSLSALINIDLQYTNAEPQQSAIIDAIRSAEVYSYQGPARIHEQVIHHALSWNQIEASGDLIDVVNNTIMLCSSALPVPVI